MKKNIIFVLITTFLLSFISVAYAAFTSSVSITGDGLIKKDTIAPTCGSWYLRDSSLTIQEAYDQNKFINPATNDVWSTNDKSLFIECTDNMSGSYGCINVTEVTDSNNQKHYYKEVKDYTASIKTDSQAISVVLMDAYQNQTTCSLPAGTVNPYIDKQAPVITITQTAANKFTYSATDDLGVKGYAVTNTNTQPTSWISTPTEITIDNTTPKTYYIWSKDEINVSHKSINTHLLTKTEGVGTTLSIKYRNNSGVELSAGYVLSGTSVYVTSTLNEGYNSLIIKKDSTQITSGSTQVIDSATTISSEATANTYTVIFNPNLTGTTGSMSPQIINYGVSTALSLNEYEKSGYNFTGWNTEPDGSGTPYSDGHIVTNLAISGTVNLYAQWNDTYQITLNNDGATTAGSNYIYEKYGDGYYLEYSGGTVSNKMTTSTNPITLPTKLGYTFLGYYTQANGQGTQYIDENGNITSSAGNTDFTANGNLYAYWVDGVAPNASLVVSPGKGSFGLTLTAIDETSGISSIVYHYKKCGGTEITFVPGENGSDSFTEGVKTLITLNAVAPTTTTCLATGWGEYIAWAVVTDGFGNSTTVYATVDDVDVPTTGYNAGYTNGKFKLLPPDAEHVPVTLDSNRSSCTTVKCALDELKIKYGIN